MKHIWPLSIVSVSIVIVCIFIAPALHADPIPGGPAVAPVTTPIPGAGGATALNSFGGRVILPKALQIQVLEATGFVCVVPGKTMEIFPFGKFPTSYFIPIAVVNKAKVPVHPGQQILGLYSIKTPIVCTNSATAVTKTVNLSTVFLFGTSKS